jgi:hypothetical protein
MRRAEKRTSENVLTGFGRRPIATVDETDFVIGSDSCNGNGVTQPSDPLG